MLTARDNLEYWAQKHMAVARGDAVVVTNDGRRVAADTLVAYTTDAARAGRAPRPQAAKAAARAGRQGADDPLAASGKLQKVEAFGNVSVRTATETVTGDRGVYVPDTGIARLGGHVRITRGQNQLNGAEAEVNMKTGVSRCCPAPPAGCRAWSCRTTPPATGRAGAEDLAPRPAARQGSASHERHAAQARTCGCCPAAAGWSPRGVGKTYKKRPGGAERLDQRCGAARRSACSARTAPARPRPST